MPVRKIQSLNVRVLSTIGAVALLIATLLPGLSIFQAQALSNSSYLTLSSFSGHPDAALTVSGGNFQVNETVRIDATEGSTQVLETTVTANASGQFSTNVTLPAKLAQGSVSFSASGETSGLDATNGYYVTPFSPSLSVSSGETIPYGSLNVAGSGYAPHESVTLNLAGATTTATADATGSFTGASVTTPNVPAASYTLTGVGQASGASAVAYEYVNRFYPSASPSSYYVMPATTLGFTGSGFAAAETVTVSDSLTGAVLSTFKTDGTGSFSDAGGFTVPASYAGLSKTFVLTGSLSNASTTVTTTIGQYYPNVSPSVYYVLPGKTLSFNGSGFLPNEVVNVYNGTTEVATTQANAKGNVVLGGTVTIPLTDGGTSQNYTLVGQTSMGSGSVSVQIGAYNPNASPSTYYALPGSLLTFSGSGYAPGETVAVFTTTGLTATNIGSITADDNGDFINGGNVTINYNQANTSASYQLVGSISNAPVNLSIGIGQLQTQISPSSYYVLPYAPFSVTISGFAPNESVTLMNGKTLLATAMTNAKGGATFTTVVLPAGIGSSAQLTATGATSGATATVSIGIGNYIPSVVASNYYVKLGTTVTLAGSGYAPNESVSIAAGGTTVTATADDTGAFTAPFVVPFGLTKNTVSIVSTGAMSGATSTTTLTLAPYTPQVSPSTYYATPGSPISFTGSGFVPGESISIALNGTVVGTETADAKGNLTSTGAYTLPFGKTAVFTVTGETSGAVNTMSIGLAQFYAGVQLSSYYGNGGSMVTASGSGFAPDELIRIQSGTATLAKGAADAEGNFSLPIQIPYVAAGKIVITATGSESGATATTGYTVAQVYNSATLGSYVVPAGSPVNIIGSGYFANEPVTVTSTASSASYSITADATGSFNDSGYIIPAGTPSGMVTLTITGTESFTTHTITIYVQGK
jgi:hypothetical protein